VVDASGKLATATGSVDEPPISEWLWPEA